MLEQIKSKLSSIFTYLEHLRGYLDIDNKNRLIGDLSSQMSHPKFWDDPQNSNRVVAQLKSLKATVEPWQVAYKRYQELKELADILKEEEQELISSLNQDLDVLLKDLRELELKTLLDGEFDKNSAILSINAGAGGTESCDWVSMLFRMYARWGQDHRYKVKTIDTLFGEEAGIKNITLLVEGEYAYGYLKAERGVHRLVRISPFDANKRRHTSFASVDVIPEIQDNIDVKVEDKDLIIETYRSSGPGGQHMQKTDSAVRITHRPTGIVVQCQNERSQYQNRQTALKVLKARLYELERRRQEEKLLKHYGAEKKKIEWGSQIRSYIMHPYNLVKDHRTGYETGDVNYVMDGGIDKFIEAYLRSLKTKA
ncbi:MAG: peptide chain release factor 2 [Candidatus Omnitrophica bacterium]|nr:peptide chain release factor 2 [Candidatus Omnitrophota bacterium]